MTRLRPGTRYRYRFVQGRTSSPVGTFRTAPLPTANQTIRFAFSGDTDAQKAPGARVPFYNAFQVMSRMAAENNNFNVHIGDTIYSDSEVPGAGALARTVPAKWGKYRQNMVLANHQRLRRATGLYSHWDDHEFINDFARAEHGSAIYNAGVKAFRDYAPVSYTPANGLYRSFRWGRNLEVFFLDERSFRSAKASSGGTCDNSGRPDFAPTAPQSTRNLFALVAPSLANPVPQACKDRINDPRRTFLGTRQFNAFTSAVRRSTATWKVVMNEMPIQQFYVNPYDGWEGYAAERRRLMDRVAAVRNVVFLSTDVHANFVNTIKFSTLGENGPTVDTGVLEVVTGPVATMTSDREFDRTLNRPGTGKLVASAFFKPPPPGGVGMKCAATDVFSYSEVRVTATSLTITPKDLNGRGVKDADGTSPCGPFVLAHR